MKLSNFVFVFAVISQSCAELFSAVEELESLSYNVENLLQQIDNFALALEESVAKLRRFLVFIKCCASLKYFILEKLK